jgi:hypothetical protein
MESSSLGIVVDLEIRETGIRVFLETADSPLPPEQLRLLSGAGKGVEFSFPGPETSAPGTLRSWLGGTPGELAENPVPASGTPPGPVAVVDEFSALFRLFNEPSETPPPETPPPAEETEPADNAETG